MQNSMKLYKYPIKTKIEQQVFAFGKNFKSAFVKRVVILEEIEFC